MTKKRKKRRKETILIILFIILAVIIGVVIVYFAQKTGGVEKEKENQNQTAIAEQNEQDATEPEYMVIVTEYGDLYYPEQWKEYLKTDQTMDGDSLKVSFSAQINDMEYPMFQVIIGDSEDTEVGELTDSSGTKRSVHMKVEELGQTENLTEIEQQRLYAMQEDLNYVIDNLK